MSTDDFRHSGQGGSPNYANDAAQSSGVPQLPPSPKDQEEWRVYAAWLAEIMTRETPEAHREALANYIKIRAEWQAKHQGEVCPCCGKPVPAPKEPHAPQG